ncbi:unnamed protein product [Prorocentrum cordatum]|uniref:Uncharacterized protein n=1 Tax=Prorocentrum cordatum TaxID=2364126 RepID=A0ABN9YK96_9DINO|nr:unnamed protein product [Polarella glacialis]
MQSAHNGAATTRIAAKVEERRLLRRRRARGKLSRARPPRLNSGATDTDMLFSPKNWVRPARREARVPNGAGATTGVTGSGCRRHEAGEGEPVSGAVGGNIDRASAIHRRQIGQAPSSESARSWAGWALLDEPPDARAPWASAMAATSGRGEPRGHAQREHSSGDAPNGDAPTPQPAGGGASGPTAMPGRPKRPVRPRDLAPARSDEPEPAR